MRLIAAAAVSASALRTGVADADAPWSALVTIDSGINGSWQQPGFAFTGDGHALVTLNANGARTPTHILAADPGASAFTETGRPTLIAAAPHDPGIWPDPH